MVAVSPTLSSLHSVCPIHGRVRADSLSTFTQTYREAKISKGRSAGFLLEEVKLRGSKSFRIMLYICMVDFLSR